MITDKNKLSRIEELVEKNLSGSTKKCLSQEEFTSFINSSLQKIYSYSSGFDITADEFIDTDTLPELDLGCEIVIFEKDMAPDINNITSYTIVEIGTGLRNGKKVTLFTIEGADGKTKKFTEEQLRQNAVSLKAYYTRLAAYEREKVFASIVNYIRTSLAELEHTLDLVAFTQECAINDVKATEHNKIENTDNSFIVW